MTKSLETIFGERIKSLSRFRHEAVSGEIFLWKQVRFLTGKTFLGLLDEHSRVLNAIAYIQDILEAERNKAKNRSSLYNGNRHIALLQAVNGLQILKEKTAPLEKNGAA